MAQTRSNKSQTPDREFDYVLALDVSSKTGWALLEREYFTDDETRDPMTDIYLKSHGALDKIQVGINNQVKIYNSANETACEIFALYQKILDNFQKTNPNDTFTVVIEQTNLGRNRGAQKYLEFTHCLLTGKFAQVKENVHYVSTSAWRHKIGLRLTKEDKEQNQRVKRKAARGKVTSKHLAVRFCNNVFKTNFKIKDNDRADAICLGVAYLLGAPSEEFFPLGLK